jgi:hypothetical protein
MGSWTSELRDEGYCGRAMAEESRGLSSSPGLAADTGGDRQELVVQVGAMVAHWTAAADSCVLQIPAAMEDADEYPQKQRSSAVDSQWGAWPGWDGSVSNAL